MLEYKDFQLNDIDLKALVAGEEAPRPGRFTGKAAVYGNVDSYRDVIVPGAMAETIADNSGRIVVLCQHNEFDSIGTATLSDAPDALYCDGQLELELNSARETYVRMQKRMLTGISIGYQTQDDSVENGVRYLKKIKLYEISLVTFPANERARVTGVKGQMDALVGDAARWLRELKEGRMLSAANLRKCQDAYDSMVSTASMLKELIDAANPPAAKNDGAPAGTTEAVAEVKAEEDVEQKKLIDDLVEIRHAIAAIHTSTR